MTRVAIASLAVVVLSLAACSKPPHVGTFVDPSGSARVTIDSDGTITTRDAAGTVMAKMPYTVKGTGADGTTLTVSVGGRTQEWRVSADGAELHGATHPAKVVFRRDRR